MLTGIHKDLAQIAEEQFKATSALFGEDAFERVRKHHDVLSWQKYYTACSESRCPKDKQLWACKNQGYTQQFWFKAWTAKKPRFSPLKKMTSQITTSHNIGSPNKSHSYRFVFRVHRGHRILKHQFSKERDTMQFSNHRK